MDSNDVANFLYDEFGQKEFLTRHISGEAMTRLARMMGIVDVGQSRLVKVGQYISKLEGVELTPASSQKVKLAVTRPEDKRRPRRFRFAPVGTADHFGHS